MYPCIMCECVYLHLHVCSYATKYRLAMKRGLRVSRLLVNKQKVPNTTLNVFWPLDVAKFRGRRSKSQEFETQRFFLGQSVNLINFSGRPHYDHCRYNQCQGKCHVFIKMLAKMRKLIKVKMMYPWSSNITQMTIKMKMNQYKDDIHQDEDDQYQHKED